MGSLSGNAPQPTAPHKLGLQDLNIATQGLGITTRVNNPTVVTPYGTTSLSQTGNIPTNTGLGVVNTPTFTSTYTPSKTQQAIIDAQQKQQLALANLGTDQIKSVGDATSGGFDLSGLSGRANYNDIPGSPYATFSAGQGHNTEAPQAQETIGSYDPNSRHNDYGTNRIRIQNALLSRTNDYLDRDREQLVQNLADRGIQEGSEAYSRAMLDHNRQRNDAYQQSVLGAGQELSRTDDLAHRQASFYNQVQAQRFGQDLTRAAYGQGAHQQNLDNQRRAALDTNERLQDISDDRYRREDGNFRNRAQGLQELIASQTIPASTYASIRFGTPISGGVGFNAPGALNNAGQAAINSNYFNSNQRNYQTALNSRNTLLGHIGGSLEGLGALAGAGGLSGLLSDRRFKTDIKRVGTLENGLPVYSYRYVHDASRSTHVGLMADEVEQVHPDAVIEDEAGVKYVNYEKAVA